MNVVVISGRLTKKPELRTTQSNMQVCQFSLAVDNGKTDDDGKRGVDFIECVCFGKTADNLVKYQDKGSMVEVKGRLQVDRYTNSEGKNTSRTLVYTDLINYINSGKKDASEPNMSQNDPYLDMGNRVENDLPF